MSMSYAYFNKNKEIQGGVHTTPCFVNAENHWEKNQYFCFYFAKGCGENKKKTLEEYINSLKELWNFGEFMEDIDWKKGQIYFDLDIVPGHMIFAICSAIRLAEESPSSVFVYWRLLNSKEHFDLDAKEKFLFCHYFHNANCNHTIYAPLCTAPEKFIAHKPEYTGGGLYGQGKERPPKGWNLPFSKHPKFRSISLYQTYSPENLVDEVWANPKKDGSFEAYLKTKAKSNLYITVKQWQEETI